MGAGNQGGGSSAEDGEIRKRFSSTKGATAKDARDYFRDRDSGKLAARSYLDSRPTDRTYSDTGAPMDDTFAENIDSKLGRIGYTRNDTSFLNADGDTVGGINQAGNFFGSRDVIDGLRGTPSLTDMRRAASRETKYGPGSRAAQEGDINTSLMDLVDFAEDGTVQGIGPNRFMDERGTGQLVYDPNAVIPGLPYLTGEDDNYYPQYDPSREGMVGQGLQGLTEYIGEGGMMGALSNASGSGDTPEIIDMNLGGVDPMRPVLRPTDGSTTENNGIMNSIYKGINYARDNPVPTDLPQYAGGYTGNGTNNAFFSSAQRDKPNAFINPAPQFNAQGAQVPFDGGNRIDVPLGIGTLPRKKTLSEPVDFSDRGSELGFVERLRDLNRFPPSVSTPGLIGQDMAEKLKREAAEQDENMYGTGMFDLRDSLKTIPAPFGNELGVPVPESTPYGGQEFPLLDREKPSFPQAESLGYSLPPTSDDRNVVPDRMRETALENQALREKGRRLNTRIDLLERDDSGIDEVNSNLYEDRFENEETKMFDFNNDLQKIIADAPYGGQEFPLLDRERPSFPIAETPSAFPPRTSESTTNFPSGASPFPPRASEPTTNFPSGSSDADNILGIEAVIDDARTKRLAGLSTSDNTMFNLEDLKDPVDTVYDDADQLEDLMTTGAIDPSGVNVGGGYTDGGGGSPTGCPEGYEPMTLENGETVCVPIEEEVEEVEEEVTPYTPAERPAMGPSAYTPQAVSPIRPYTLRPGEQGVGSLADILQLQNYPTVI